jgi:ribulose-5-phosphate 4-epimerase/fuculose-1-phosphate aldolase
MTDIAPKPLTDARCRDEARTFAVNGVATTTMLRWFVDGLERTLVHEGYAQRANATRDVHVVVHLLDPEDARPFRRKNAPTFVIAVAELPEPPSDLLATGYPLLVRGLANLAVLLSEDDDGPIVHFVTLEQGTYCVGHVGDDDKFFRQVFDRVEPLARSRLVIANDFVDDLPRELWNGDEQTLEVARAGERLAALDLLPTPYPLDRVLAPRDLRHVKLLFGIGGLSYGNVSLRRIPRTESAYGPEFWMSASGVDKGNLRVVGRDVLLVRGFDPERGCIVLSVPAAGRPNRVSVDAIEHWTIYRDHPEVGAILHVHAWIDGTEATDINYPCGTMELASAVADLVRRAPDPAAAVVGQRNHGLTITGRSLDEIFGRIGASVVRTVPMS